MQRIGHRGQEHAAGEQKQTVGEELNGLTGWAGAIRGAWRGNAIDRVLTGGREDETEWRQSRPRVGLYTEANGICRHGYSLDSLAL